VFRRFSDMPGWGDHPWMQEDQMPEPKKIGGLAQFFPPISICIPVMNRLDDLRQIMPELIQNANRFAPVEIVILDYNSSDGLGEYIAELQEDWRALVGGSCLTYRRYEGRDTYHMAHARNLSVKASSGEYIIVSSADIAITADYLRAARANIADGCVWMYPPRYVGVICVSRAEFEAAGGFDERFEWYGKEDKDLHARLLRRGGKVGIVPPPVEVVRTPWEKKMRHYRGHPGRAEMHQETLRIYEENQRYGVLVANEGREWGQW